MIHAPDVSWSHRGGVGPQRGPLWLAPLLPLCLSALLLLQVSLHSTDGLEGEHGAGRVQDGRDEAEQSHGRVPSAHIAVQPGVAVACVESLPALANIRGVDPHDEVQVEADGRHVAHRTRRLKHQGPDQELAGHQVGGFGPGDHKQQRDDPKGQTEGHAPVDARRSQLAVVHVQVSSLLQLGALQAKLRVDVEAAQRGSGGQACGHHVSCHHAHQDQRVGQYSTDEHDACSRDDT